MLAMVVLVIGTFIGGAFGPQPDETQADEPGQSVVVMANPPRMPPAPGAPSPAGSGPNDIISNSSRASTGSRARAADHPAARAASNGGAPAEIPESPTPGAGTNGPHRRRAAAAPRPLPPIKHVFTIVLSGRSFGQLFASASPSRYLAHSLETQGTLLSGYHAVAHGGLAGRVALISGQAPTPEIAADCLAFADLLPGTLDNHGQSTGAGCIAPRPVQTVAEQLSAKGLAWRAYLQGMDAPGQPPACRHPVPGAPDDTIADRPSDHYATASNPFVYFHSVIDVGDCNANVVAPQRLAADLASSDTTPAYAFIAPDRCHDGRDAPCADGQAGGPAATEAFLRSWVPAILASAAYRRDGLLVITADHAPSTGRDADSHGCCGQRRGGGRVGALLLSRYVRAGKVVRTPYNHYALLRTVEDLFGLSHLAHAGDNSVKAFGREVFGDG